MPENLKDWIRLVPVAAGILVAVWLGYSVVPATAKDFDWFVIAKLVGVLVLSFGLVAVLRYAIVDAIPASSGGAPVTDPEAPIRSKIAPLVIGIGTAGIAIVAFGVIVAVHFADDPEVQGKLDTIVLSIFSAVLPVFATWVGTVIAFYFSNESFRQAAESSRNIIVAVDDGVITDARRMVPYSKITKIELPDAAANVKAESVEMAKVRALFSDTVTRVIIFDKNRMPLLIVRKKFDTNGQAKTVGEYLATGRNTVDSKNFRFLPARATVADAKRTVELYNVTDLFVTDNGLQEEPVTGWVPDDQLK